MLRIIYPSNTAKGNIKHPVYKYGKTTRLHNRFKQYPINSIALYVNRVKNCHIVEDEMHKIFKKYFIHEKTCGKEYFSGNGNKMIEYIKKIIEKMNQHVDDISIEARLRVYYKDHIKVCFNIDVAKVSGNNKIVKITKDCEIIEVINGNNSDSFDIIDNEIDHKQSNKNNIQSKHTCPNCGKEFNSKQSQIYHMDKNVCTEKKYKCRYCPSKFASKNGMYIHMRETCKSKKQNNNEKDMILSRLVKLEEDNKSRNEKIQKLKKENKEIKTQIKKDRTSIINSNNEIKNNNNNINININNAINNGTVINNTINLIAYGNEDMSKISDANMLKILQSGYQSTTKLTEAIHFNPNFPEYHNIYIPNMKDKYAMVYDGIQWVLITKVELIEKIYENKKDYIENNLDRFMASLTISRKNALRRWLDTDEEDIKIKNIKESIKLLLYNSKHFALKCRNMIANSNKPQTIKSKSIKSIKDG